MAIAAPARARVPRLVLAAAVCAALCGCASPTSREAESHLDESVRLLRANKTESAMAKIAEATKVDPTRRQTYLRAIRLLIAYKRFKKAGEVGETMIRRAESGELDRMLSRDEMAGLHLLVGQAHQEAGDNGLAESRYKRALELAPDSALALNALGWLYADNGIELEKALKLTRRAVELAPGEAAIVDSLGWTLYKLGRSEEAIRTLKRAVELDPNHPELRYHLGAAYAKAGLKTEAVIELNKALLLDSDLTDAYTLLNKIRAATPDKH